MNSPVISSNCLLTDLPITSGESVRIVFIAQQESASRHFEPIDIYRPISVPLKGRLGPYGLIDEIDSTHSAEYTRLLFERLNSKSLITPERNSKVDLLRMTGGNFQWLTLQDTAAESFLEWLAEATDETDISYFDVFKSFSGRLYPAYIKECAWECFNTWKSPAEDTLRFTVSRFAEQAPKADKLTTAAVASGYLASLFNKDILPLRAYLYHVAHLSKTDVDKSGAILTDMVQLYRLNLFLTITRRIWRPAWFTTSQYQEEAYRALIAMKEAGIKEFEDLE